MSISLLPIIGKKSPFRWIFDCIIQGKIRLCITTEILFEYWEVLERKNGTDVAENVINFITVSPFTEKIEVFYNFRLIEEDEDDNKYVDCAIAADAACLVSNDNHFNILNKTTFPKVLWMRLEEFEEKYKQLLIN